MGNNVVGPDIDTVPDTIVGKASFLFVGFVVTIPTIVMSGIAITFVLGLVLALV